MESPHTWGWGEPKRARNTQRKGAGGRTRAQAVRRYLRSQRWGEMKERRVQIVAHCTGRRMKTGKKAMHLVPNCFIHSLNESLRSPYYFSCILLAAWENRQKSLASWNFRSGGDKTVHIKRWGCRRCRLAGRHSKRRPGEQTTGQKLRWSSATPSPVLRQISSS